MSEIKKEWYVVRAIGGKENKVKEYIEAEIRRNHLEDYISQVLIPTEKVYTTRGGKKVIKERVLYSGYVFIKAHLTGEIAYELRNTTNVIDFLRGRAKGSQPEPLRESEVMRMMGAADELGDPEENTVIDFMVGEPVKVTVGPFSGFAATVKEVSAEKQKLKVEVKIFGRPTDLELEYSQVEKV